MREAWTDERLDDLNRRVSEGFADVRVELRTEIAAVREEIGALREELGRMQRTTIYCFVSLATMMVTGFIAIGTQLQ